MKTLAVLLGLCDGNPQVTSGFPSQRASNVCFDVFVDVILNKRFNKYSIYRWFETTWCLLRRHYNDIITQIARFMGPTWGSMVLSAPDGPHVGPMNLVIRAIIRHQYIRLTPTNAYMHPYIKPSLVQTMICFLFDAKPLSEPMLTFCQLGFGNRFQSNLNQNTTVSIHTKRIWKHCLCSGGHFVSVSKCQNREGLSRQINTAD